VRFLVDAQLPRALSDWITREGHDSIHTFDLPNRIRTTWSAHSKPLLPLLQQHAVVESNRDQLVVHA